MPAFFLSTLSWSYSTSFLTKAAYFLLTSKPGINSVSCYFLIFNCGSISMIFSFICFNIASVSPIFIMLFENFYWLILSVVCSSDSIFRYDLTKRMCCMGDSSTKCFVMRLYTSLSYLVLLKISTDSLTNLSLAAWTPLSWDMLSIFWLNYSIADYGHTPITLM